MNVLKLLQTAQGDTPILNVVYKTKSMTARYEPEEHGLWLYNSEETDDEFYPMEGDFIPDDDINDWITILDELFMEQFK